VVAVAATTMTAPVLGHLVASTPQITAVVVAAEAAEAVAAAVAVAEEGRAQSPTPLT
jgi:hypothetical protein